ncbi:integrase catalytic domain-containing protein [Trichonephila clavipes]|nr:integrase catalytic domain-containing protein [Trichonephila clavipes]
MAKSYLLEEIFLNCLRVAMRNIAWKVRQMMLNHKHGGNKRKLSVALSLIGSPPLILLDGPTAGVDPVSRRKIWNILSHARKSTGAAVILSTHREKALRIELKSKRVLEIIKSKQNNNEGSNSGNNSHLADCENPHKAITPRLLEVELYKFGVQSTKIKSEARELIESFPITNENYPLAIESLVERYGRNELLIDFYVRELLKLVLNNATKKKQDSLSGLYNKLSTQLRALSSLGITTEQCGIILYPLVESALPTHILRSFERQRKNETATLDSIVSFLKSEMQSEEKIKLSRSDIFPYPRECKQLAESQRSLPSANELFINEPNEIYVLCLKNHPVRFCKRAFFIPLEEKNAIIKRKGLCRICLAKGHLASRCRSQITCQLCSKRHVKFMCPNIECNKSDSLKQDVNDKNINENTVDSLHSRATNEVILQTLVVNVHGIKRERKARAIIDTGSQKSYILRSTAEELGFNLQREEEFRHSLFGGTKTRMYKHKCYKIYLSSLDGLIEVLLGADVAGKLITGRREELKTGLVALETKLGWTLMGKVPRYTDKKDTSMNIVTMLSQEDIPVSSLWDLEMLGIRDTIEQNSREEKEKAVMSHFLETVRQKEDGRYEVHMPWKVDWAFLTDNYELCLKRLESTTRKLEKIGFREKYHEVFREWLAEGVIEEVPGKELPVRTHYLPHRPVIKETSATSSMKIRPVFDASAKINNHPSLNDCLETGNNLIESVPAILARFRLKPIGVISDIRRAFLQISLHGKDRDFVRFLWYDNEDNIRTYRRARVAFGVTSSPFLLMAVINYHLLIESQ